MQKIDSYISRHFHKIFWILSGSFFVLYLMQVGGDTIWTDEAYSFAMVKHSFSEIWTITAADVHPPIYYWYLKILTAPFHYSLLAAQIASILPYLFILIFGGIQIKKYFNEKTAILFMVMFFAFRLLCLTVSKSECTHWHPPVSLPAPSLRTASGWNMVVGKT